MIQMLLPWLADALVVLGLIIMSAAVYGLFWLPDLYTRLHAASKAVTLGIIPILLASLVTWEPAIICRVILIVIFLFLTTPVSAHVIGRVAYMKREPIKVPDVIDESGHLPVEPPSGKRSLE